MQQLSAAVNKRSGSVARRFESVLDLLDKEGFTEGWSLTSAGHRLVAIYHECDLVVAEGLESGVFDDLGPADLAAVAACLTYEERRADAPDPAPLPRHLQARLARLMDVARRLQQAERARGLPMTRLPDGGFSALARAWASGSELADILEGELPAGDFVRNTKLLIDLLGQLGDAAPSAATSATARQAAELLTRGVVAAASELTTA